MFLFSDKLGICHGVIEKVEGVVAKDRGLSREVSRRVLKLLQTRVSKRCYSESKQDISTRCNKDVEYVYKS